MSTPRDYIGSKLRELRKRKGVTGIELAKLIKYSQASLSKIERGLLKPSVELVTSICAALNLSKSEAHSLVEQTRLFLNEFSRWNVEALDSIPETQKIIESRELKVKLFRSLQLEAVPGLLQTKTYMYNLFRALGLNDKKQLEQAIKFRTHRQKLLVRENKRFQFLITEGMLLPSYIASSEMEEQLEKLLQISENPNIEIQILGFGQARSVCPVTSFDIFDDSFVTIETISHQLTIWTEPDVSRYVETFVKLKDLSLSSTQSSELLRSRITEIKRLSGKLKRQGESRKIKVS